MCFQLNTNKQQTTNRTAGLDLLVKHCLYSEEERSETRYDSWCLSKECDVLVTPNRDKLSVFVRLCQHIIAGCCADDRGFTIQYTTVSSLRYVRDL